MNRRVSIAVLLIAVMLGVVTLLLGSFTLIVYQHEAAARQAALEAKAESTADQLAATLGLPVWNLDPLQIRSTIHSAMSDRTVQAVEVVALDTPMATMRSAQWAVVDAETVAPAVDALVRERNILHGGESVGKVRVHLTTRFLAEELAAWRRSSLLLIVGLDLVIVLSLALLLWYLMLRPVRSLDRYAAAVTAGNPSPVPEPALFVGELRTLSDSVRQMVMMLSSRYNEIETSEERLRLANRSASIGVWEWDAIADKVVYDDEMLRIYGLTRGQFNGDFASWCASLEPGGLKQAIANVHEALETGSLSHEFTIVRPDGARRVIRGEGTAQRDEAGRVVRLVGINIDVTERHAADEEILRLNAGLERRVEERTAQLQRAVDEVVRTRDQAEAATRIKSEFLANMSHEIRTPMNAVLGMTELALRGDLAPKQRAYLTKAKSAGESLLGIINDILDFSKIEADRLELERKSFALADVIRKVHAVVALRGREKGLQMSLAVADATPKTLVGDPLRLEQVLVNLCSNAVKFTERGSVELSVTRVDYAGVLDGSDQAELLFVVRDTGIGMSAEQVGQLFEPFNQLDPSTTRKHGGTGLGLAICRRLVGMMGGEIGVTSTPGRGSEFRFTARFGLVDPAARAVLPAPARPDEIPSVEALAGQRVLLVEDNDLNQIVAADLLRDACGMQVTVAANGFEALEQLGMSRFDAVLLDIQMPDMDGYEVARRVRAHQTHAKLPIIAMSAHALARDREKCVAAGMNDFITKPFEPEALFAVLGKWVTDAPPVEHAVAPSDEGEAGGVSIELGLRRCMGKPALYEKIARRHVEAQPTAPEQIRRDVAYARWAEAARGAHSLVSTAGTLGAARLAALARALEAAIEQGPTETLTGLLVELTQEHGRVVAALRQHLGRLEGRVPPSS